jgi:transcriptional regulator with GAF, ATPase, and Fis domain
MLKEENEIIVTPISCNNCVLRPWVKSINIIQLIKLFDSWDRDDSVLPTLNIEKLKELAIRQALEKADYVQQDAAKLLGITPRVLTYILKSKPELRDG